LFSTFNGQILEKFTLAELMMKQEVCWSAWRYRMLYGALLAVGFFEFIGSKGTDLWMAKQTLDNYKTLILQRGDGES